MENNSQNRKHPTKNVRITKFSAEKDDSYKVQVSIKLVPLTKERIAFACTGHENEQKNRKRKRLISAEKEQQANTSQDGKGENSTSATRQQPMRRTKRECSAAKNKQCPSAVTLPSMPSARRKRKLSISAEKEQEANTNQDGKGEKSTDVTRKQPIREAKRLSMTSKIVKQKRNPAKQNDAKKKLEEIIKNDAPINQFAEGEVVLGTIPGYAPWPARIHTIIADTIYIEFFGTGQVNPVRLKSIQRFDVNKVIPLLERKGYMKAVRELEMTLKIGYDISLFKENAKTNM